MVIKTVLSRGSRWLTVTELAERHNVSTKTVRRRIADGELHAHRLGRLLRVSEEDLALYESRIRK
jgi:excisionase family DNA binding protein